MRWVATWRRAPTDDDGDRSGAAGQRNPRGGRDTGRRGGDASTCGAEVGRDTPDRRRRVTGHRPGSREGRNTRLTTRSLRAHRARSQSGLRTVGARLAAGHTPRIRAHGPVRQRAVTDSRRADRKTHDDTAVRARTSDKAQSAGRPVVRPAFVGGLRDRADAGDPGRGGRPGAQRVAADHGCNRSPPDRSRRQLSPDDQGVPEGWRLVHRRQGQSGGPHGSDRRGRADG